MAVIRSMSTMVGSGRIQPTEVDAGWTSLIVEGEVIFQFSTFGSDQRKSEKKVSQTIQLNRKMALQLREALDSVFTFDK